MFFVCVIIKFYFIITIYHWQYIHTYLYIYIVLRNFVDYHLQSYLIKFLVFVSKSIIFKLVFRLFLYRKLLLCIEIAFNERSSYQKEKKKEEGKYARTSNEFLRIKNKYRHGRERRPIQPPYLFDLLEPRSLVQISKNNHNLDNFIRPSVYLISESWHVYKEKEKKNWQWSACNTSRYCRSRTPSHHFHSLLAGTIVI